MYSEGLLYHSEPPFRYFSEDLIGLSCFDSRLPVSDKQAKSTNVQATMKEPRNPQAINLPLSQVSAATLPSFATKIPSLFENLISRPIPVPPNPRKWQEEESYVEACRRIEGLRVVKTQPSEEWRSSSPSTSGWTPDKEQRQFLLQVVEAHRHQQPGTRRLPFPGQAGHNEWGGSP
ncbi:hypothetical protein GWK47_033830 [Chionoecetes opilio]|uniref:Uncharacterized protein n=1 Tax=Chionoecetes opilio TaxID=41210 RepID=A0A8J5D060_CHIOP|nr:hypothetical protein GWK47_033830 [Chionoecetes opilio]